MPDPTLYYPRCRCLIQVALDGLDDSAYGGKENPLDVWALPKHATIHRNGYHQADSWEVTFEYLELPFDPSQIRAGSIDLYIFDAGGVYSDEAIYSRQYANAPGSVSGSTSLDMDDRDARQDKSAFVGNHDPQITGLFDDQDIEFSEDGRWVTIRGQDYTDFLAKKPWQPTSKGRARRIPVGDRIDVLFRNLLEEVDPSGVLGVKVDGIDEERLPIVTAGDVAGHKRGIPIQKGVFYWDVFLKVAERLGLIVYVKLREVVISKPKSLDDISSPDIKQMAWGSNILNLRMTRHFGREKLLRVVMTSWDDRNLKLITVEEPERGNSDDFVLNKHPSKKSVLVQHIKTATAKKNAVKPRDKTTTINDEFVYMSVKDGINKETLREMAKTWRNTVGRGERKMVVKTRDLCDMNGNQILDMYVGDAAFVQWKDFNLETMQNPELTTERRIQMIEARGYQPSVARVIATNYQRLLATQAPMRIRECTIDFDVDNGVEIEMELLDFITMTLTRQAKGPESKPIPSVDKRIKAIMRYKYKP